MNDEVELINQNLTIIIDPNRNTHRYGNSTYSVPIQNQKSINNDFSNPDYDDLRIQIFGSPGFY